ncbi:hypothetical protein MY3957_009598 [Beauveria namnaoensis]
MESAQRAFTGKKSLWQSIRSNPKVVFIALFASLGGFEYGYQQGVLGQSLVMTRFTSNFPSVVQSSSATGWLTSILQLGGILGSLSAGILSELISRKRTMFVACLWVILGSYLYLGAKAGAPSLLYAGRFFTGVGVGIFSGVAPLYNAELSLPEMRGFLVSFYQFATILGIMLSFWIGYGSNYIGGTGDSQSDLSWRLPSIIQGIPAAALAIGIWFMPYSPRWLVKVGRDEEAKATLAWMRKLPVDDKVVQVEFLEIKAESVFEKKAFARDFPKMADASRQNAFKEQIAQYINCFRTRDNFKRIATGFLVMAAQQWSGIDAIIYYATNIFQSLGLTSGTNALLATGVTGVVFMASTIPAMVGALDYPSIGFLCAAGWAAVALIWVYIAGFGATWGPVSWTLVSEIFPLSIRAKGSSIGAFSNWLNNFAIAFYVPPMLEAWAWGTYIFFAVFLAAGAVWVWLCLPETKNASLEEMDRVFNSHTGARDAQLLHESQQEVGLTALLESQGVVHDKAGSVAVIEHVQHQNAGGAQHAAGEAQSDEKKPQCASCESRKVVCKYVITPDPRSGTYTEITFIDEKPSSADVQPSSEDCNVASARQPPRCSVRWQQPASQPASQPATNSPAAISSWDSYFDTELPEVSQRDIALLRQFRYRTAPWLEAGDPNSKFGVAMMRMAQEHELIRILLTELASSHLLGRFSKSHTQEAQTRLKACPELEYVADALIHLTETLCAGPLAWRQFRFQHGTCTAVEEPLRTLIQQLSRIAASILTTTPPETESSFCLLRPEPGSEGNSVLLSAYNWALYHLTSCLHFVYRSSAASTEAARASSSSPGAVLMPGAPPDWQTLWLRIQSWYDARPVEFQSLVDVGSIERSQIDPMNAASFPIHLFSSAIAVQAATFYHTTALLLLQHKPRLLSIPGRRQHLTSANWHARAIAGIITSNEFPEQWDPVVIASALHIAKDITHSAQQQAMLACLQNITFQAGIPLGEEEQQLRAIWAAANLVESSLSR